MTKEVNYRALSEELEEIVAAMQQDDIDIDEAMVKYERGQELIGLLETYLKSSENKIEKLANLKG